MGTATKVSKKDPKDYYWADDREPHFQRRKDIMAAHPEVKELFGIDKNLKYWTVLLVVAQLTLAYFVGQLSWLPFILITYCVGATIGQALFLAVHEITHNLAFKSKKYNNILALIANLPIVVPMAMSFKRYHGMHHWDQGKDGIDTDIPTEFEANLFTGVIGKLFWFTNQILAYAFRPIITKPLKLDKWQIYNTIFQVVAMAIYLPFVGWSGLLFLALSIFLAGSLHPTAGHFISEHYVFEEGQETYSYYGPLNKVTFNAGYHNEHHDFPGIPGSRLPELKKTAPEYYDSLHSYDSWTNVIFKFIFNKDITLFSRTKRK